VDSESGATAAAAVQWSAAGQRFGRHRRYSVEINPSACLPDVLPAWSTPHGNVIDHVLVVT